MAQPQITAAELLTLSDDTGLEAGNVAQSGPNSESWIQFQTYNEHQYCLGLDPPDVVYANQLLVAATNTWG